MKLLPYDYHVSFEPGVLSPCDYGYRHPPSTQLDNDLIDDWNVEIGTEILVNRIESDSLEATVTLDEVRSATQEDPALSFHVHPLDWHTVQMIRHVVHSNISTMN
jgi:hypothetical protein